MNTDERNQITVEILPDGRIKIDTGDMSGPTHTSADNFLKSVERLMGGEVEVQKRRESHTHHHTHTHEHHHH